MSALPPKADIGTQSRNVRFVPKADIAARAESRRFQSRLRHLAVMGPIQTGPIV